MVAKSSGKWLRIVTFIFFALATAFTLMGGAGTSCAAFDPVGNGFPQLENYKLIYKEFVYTGVLAGLVQLVALILLIRGKSGSVGIAIVSILASLFINRIHIVASTILGSVPQPVFMVFGLNLIALLILLVCLIPPVARFTRFEDPARSKKDTGKGVAAATIAAGISVITAPFWAGQSHTIAGYNYANAWPFAMNLIGFGLVIVGTVILFHRPRQFVITEKIISEKAS
jgi:hypothetical protein